MNDIKRRIMDEVNRIRQPVVTAGLETQKSREEEMTKKFGKKAYEKAKAGKK